jgi:hypothetical protein
MVEVDNFGNPARLAKVKEQGLTMLRRASGEIVMADVYVVVV